MNLNDEPLEALSKNPVIGLSEYDLAWAYYEKCGKSPTPKVLRSLIDHVQNNVSDDLTEALDQSMGLAIDAIG